MSAGGKKRPRADLLSSLDAIFSSVTQPKASKYTALASSQGTSKGIVQQAYQHSKRKRVNKKRQLGSTTQESNNEANKKEENNEKQPKKNDLLYEKLDLDLLAIGLKDCSLQSQIKSFTKPHAYHETLKSYLEAVTKGSKASSTAVDSLKNKVLSLDNPFKNTAADTTKKAIARASLKQTHKLISARQRRKLGLHVLGKEMSYCHAEQLHRIWTRYVSQVIESDIATVQPVVEEEQRRRNAKLQTKFKYLDLSGCRAEVKLKDSVKCSIDGVLTFLCVFLAVIESLNPCNVGFCGIIVAENMHTIQICRPVSVDSDNTQGCVCTLVKSESCFKVFLSSNRSLILDGAWFAERAL